MSPVFSFDESPELNLVLLQIENAFLDLGDELLSG